MRRPSRDQRRAITGYGRSEDRRRAQEAVDRFLVKPVDGRQLREALGEAQRATAPHGAQRVAE